MTDNKYRLITKLFLAWLFILSTCLVYIPHLIYFPNQQAFASPFLHLITSPVLIAASCALVLSFICLALPLVWLKICVAVSFFLGFLIFINGALIPHDIGLIDGQTLEFDTANWWLGLILIITAVLVAAIKHKWVNKNLPYLSLVVIFSQTSIVSYVIYQQQDDKPGAFLSDNEFHSYSSEKNITLIILDTFGSQIFNQMLSADPEIPSTLNGFKHYPDTISNYPATIGSIPSLLTGQMLPFDQTYDDFLEQKVATIGLPDMMASNGYKSSFISISPRFRAIYPQRFKYQPDSISEIQTLSEGYKLIDYSMLRILPKIIKPTWYNNGHWTLSNLLSSSQQVPSLLPEKSMEMFSQHIENLTVIDSKPRFKVLHFGLPHPEYVYDENCLKTDRHEALNESESMVIQSQCAFKKTTELLARYEKENIYDQSMIIITSDHGARLLRNMSLTGFPSFFELNSSGSLFLIKGMNQKQPFESINNPLSLIKLYDLVLNEQEHESSFNDLVHSERKFYAYRNIHRGAEGYLPDAPLYQVKADYSNPDSWHLIEIVTTHCEGETIPFAMQFKTKHRQQFCSRHGFAKPDRKNNGTWTRSVDPRILFNINQESIGRHESYELELSFDANINEKQPFIEINVVLNGQSLGSQFISNQLNNTVNMPLEGKLLKADSVNQLQLLMPDLKTEDEIKNNKNTRRLGIFLRTVKVFEGQSF